MPATGFWLLQEAETNYVGSMILRCFQTSDVYISILYFGMFVLHMDSVDSVFVVYNCEARIAPVFRSYLAIFL